MSGLPFMKFFPTNWMSDPAVRMCSGGARGLWIDMICLMHEARGFLKNGDKDISLAQLGRLTGFAQEEVERLIAELEAANVFSRDTHGSIYCRRMVREFARAELPDPGARERMRKYRQRRNGRAGQALEGIDNPEDFKVRYGNRNGDRNANVTDVTPIARVRSQTFSNEKEESLTTPRNGAAVGCALLGAASPTFDDDQKEQEIKLLLGRVDTEFLPSQRLRIIAKLEHVENRAAYLHRCLAKPHPRPGKVVPIDPELAEMRQRIELIRQRKAAQ